MDKVILVIHVLTALAIIGLILLQQGKGAEAGASFGAGASQTVFGSQGSGNFFTRATAILAAIFFVTSFGLAVLAKQQAAVTATAGMPVVDESIPAVVEEPEIPVMNESVPSQEVPAAPEAEELPQ